MIIDEFYELFPQSQCKLSFLQISVGGPDRFLTDASGKRWRFEMHPYSGPIVLTSNGAVAETQPGPRSPFWRAVSLWTQQGEALDGQGNCLWAEPGELKLVHLGGRHYAVENSTIAAQAKKQHP